MALQLAPEEPEAGPWRVATLNAVMTTLMRNGPREPAGRPVVIAVDGRSSGGKTTLAARMQGAVPGGCPLLLIEGVGSGRRDVAGLIDALVWVQSDLRQTRERDLDRVGTPGGAATIQFLHDWMAEEIPFVAADRAWERADLIICGTPQLPHDPRTELIAAPPSVIP